MAAEEIWLHTPVNETTTQSWGDARVVDGVAALRWGSPAAEHKMLAVHGRLDNAASFNFVGPLFAAAGYELVAIDLPGHGHSPWKPDGIYSLLSQAASVAQALDALGWSSCTMLAHSLGCSYATVVVGALPGRFAACIFIEGFSGFGLSFAVDFGIKSEDADERRVTAEPRRLRMSLTNGTQLHLVAVPLLLECHRHALLVGFAAIAKLGRREPRVYESVQAAVDARTSGAFAMENFGAEALVRRGGAVDEHTQSFHFTHDTRANVSYMLQVLSDEQAAELMEQVPRSLVLCAESVRQLSRPSRSSSLWRM